MEELKLWLVGGSKDSPTITDILSAAQTQTEEFLEEIIVKSPNLLANGLTLVGRQTQTPSGPLDLLGVDEDGRLVVFELKRGTLTREAVAQVVDYASYLSQLSPSELNTLICQNSGTRGIEKCEDFEIWYQENRGKNLDTLGKPKMTLVGLGIDERARRMVDFLSVGNIEISLIIFHGFNYNNKIVLARQIEIPQKQIVEAAKYSKATNLQRLLKKIKDAGVESYFEVAAGVIRVAMNGYQYINPTGYTYSFQETTESGTPSNRAYVAILIPEGAKGSAYLSLQERAIKAAGAEWTALSQAWGDRIIPRKGYFDVRIASGADWKELEPDVRRLCLAIVEGRKSLQERSLQEQKVLAEREIVREMSESQA